MPLDLSGFSPVEKGAKGRTSPLGISISNHSITLSASAHDAIGKPEYVELYANIPDRTIAILPANKSGGRSFKLHPVYHAFSCSALTKSLRSAGLLSGRVKAPARVEDGALVAEF